MRKLFKLGLFVILSATLIGAPTFASPTSPASAPLGMILEADNGQVGVDINAGGSTIYDGDRLQTDAGGTLRAKLGGSQMYLRSNTVAQVHGLPNGFSAELGAGTVVISSTEGQIFQLLADGATIRPASQQATIAQVTRVNDNEVLLTSTRGALQITMGDESRTIESGSSYRMEIESEDPGPQGGPAHTGHRRRLALYLIGGGIAVATTVLIWRAMMSPSGL